MTRFATSAAVAAAMMLGGCASSIHVAQLAPGTTPIGVPWNLAMTQYTVTITRQVTGCNGSLEGNVTVSAVPGRRLDEDQQYVLRSSGVWATADITSTLAPDGTSLGLNAHSEDQTAAVIANVVGILSAVAKGAATVSTQTFSCSDTVTAALNDMKPRVGKSLKEQVDDATRALAAATYTVTQLTPLYPATGQGGKAASRAPLIRAVSGLIALQATLDRLQARLTADLKTLTSTQTVAWPPRADESATARPFELPQSVARAWVKWSTPGVAASPPPLDVTNFRVWLGLYRQDGQGGWAIPTAAPAKGDVTVGVPVRLPRLGRLLACTTEACPSTLPRGWVGGDDQTVLVQPDAAVLQFGQLYNVPLTGGTFKSEGAVIAMDATGLPTSIQVTEKQAAATAATGAIGSAASSLADLPAQLAAARLTRTQASTNQVNADNALAAARAAAPYAQASANATAQNAYLTAVNTLAATQASQPTVGDTAAANAQAAWLNATTSRATAQANADAAGELGQLAAQTAIARQQAELATQQAQLGAGQANLAVAPAVAALGAQTSLINAETAQINAEVAKAKAEQSR